MSARKKGILCLLASSFCFAMMNVFVRLSGDLPSLEKSFFRNLVALLVAGVMIARAGTGFSVKKGQTPDLFIRSLLGTLGLLCNFYCVDHMLLADATAIQKLVPFVTLVSSAVILKERIKWWQSSLVLLAFLASLLVVKPGFSDTTGVALVQVAGALCAGGAYTYVRKLTLAGVEKPKIIFWFSTFSCLAVVPFLLVDFVLPAGSQWLFLILTGIAASGGQFAITYAYSFAPASQISIYDYSQIVFSALLGFVFFGQTSDWMSWLGYILLTAIALLNFWIQNRKVH